MNRRYFTIAFASTVVAFVSSAYAKFRTRKEPHGFPPIAPPVIKPIPHDERLLPPPLAPLPPPEPVNHNLRTILWVSVDENDRIPVGRCPWISKNVLVCFSESTDVEIGHAICDEHGVWRWYAMSGEWDRRDDITHFAVLPTRANP